MKSQSQREQKKGKKKKPKRISRNKIHNRRAPHAKDSIEPKLFFLRNQKLIREIVG